MIIEAIIDGRLVWRQNYDLLATYNSEVARGIVHTKEYSEKMMAIQKEYDEAIVNIIKIKNIGEMS